LAGILADMTTKIADLAEGKLYLTGGGPATLVESPFAQGILDRVERDRDRHDWKSSSAGWNLSAGGMPGLPGLNATRAEVRRVRFTSISGAGDGLLLYSLDTDHVGGVFRRDLNEDHEQRLLHRQNLRASDIAIRPADGMLAVALQREDGTAHLAVMSGEGRGLREVTEGDAVDQAPSWAGGDAILFQSAGIGRNAAGFFVSLGPYAVHRLDLAAAAVTTVVESEGHDHLMPKRAGEHLYFIRRPYQPGGEPLSPWRVAGDVLLFPFRLGRAVVHFLNFMSLMFARKPLITAGGPPKEGPDQRYMMVWGKLIDAEKILKRQRGDGAGALVPKEWQLVRRTADGREDVLAENVLAYDVRGDGEIAYTDGTRIRARTDGETTWREVGRGKLIERLAFA
jgi:hypothetical protein